MFYFSLFSKSKATENPSECVHGVSLLHTELIVTQTGTYSVRPGREYHWYLKQRSVYPWRMCWDSVQDHPQEKEMPKGKMVV